jgi:glycosyltransferase involved in cell wall biosynthesis
MLTNLKKYYRLLEGYSQAMWYNFSNRHAQFDLLILDDFFPNPLSSFRYAEYNYYFQNSPNTVLYTTGGSWLMMNEVTKVPVFIKKYNQTHPENRVFAFNAHKKPFAKFCYVIFLSLTYQFLNYIEKHELDFVFCLYPGGQFHLDTAETDEKLAAVCGSPYFKGVVVTQKITYDYLIKKKFCQPHQIRYVFGVVLPIQEYTLPQNRLYFGANKAHLDICFMANKYSKGGVDKGFDVFAAVAQYFLKQPNIRFHVIGPFEKSDVETYDAQNKWTLFYRPIVRLF